MKLKIYNTLTREKEPFESIEPGKVLMYVCGPTVYDSCHIGHARAFVVFDVIVRYLEAKGMQVTYVRNFTDVDDKIINRANELKMSSLELADLYITEFQNDMKTLHVAPPTFEPRGGSVPRRERSCRGSIDWRRKTFTFRYNQSQAQAVVGTARTTWWA